MSSRPDHWKHCTIGSLCELINGRAFKPTDWGNSGLPIVRIQNLNSEDAKFNYFKGEVRARFLIDTGALLFAWSGTPGTSFGAHIWKRGPAILNQHIFNVVFDETIIDKQFFRLAINQKLDELIDKAHGGVGLRHVTKGKFEETEIGLPPLDDQVRIVAKVNGHLTRSKTAREELARIPTLIERLKLAVLAAAIHGHATVCWRAANPVAGRVSLLTQAPTTRGKREGGNTAAESSQRFRLPKTWTAATIESIGKVILGRQRSPEHHKGPQMRPYVRAANITWDGWDLSDVKRMNFDERDFKRFKLQPGDVLVNEGSGSADEVGKPAIWNGEITNCCFQNTLIAVRPHATTPEYLYFVLLHAALSRAFVDEARGVNIHHIGRAGLAQFVVPVPPLEEQHEIARHIRVAFSKVDKLAAETERAAGLLDRLDQSMLAKAFRGELTESKVLEVRVKTRIRSGSVEA